MTRDDATMSLLEHLEELRSRIIVIAIAVLVAAIVGFFLADPIITLLRAPLPTRAAPSSSRRTSARRSASGCSSRCTCGIALAMPVILYEIWALRDAGPDAAASGAWSGRCSIVAVAPLRRGRRRSATSSSRWRSTSSSTSRCRAFEPLLRPRRLHRLRDDLPARLRPRAPVPGHPLPAGARRDPQLRASSRAVGAG